MVARTPSAPVPSSLGGSAPPRVVILALLLALTAVVPIAPATAAAAAEAAPGLLAAPVETELHTAARLGELGRVKALVAAGAEVDPANRYGSTPLALAAANGRLEVVRYLLSAGADPDTIDHFYGVRPLEWALQGGHREVVHLLLTNGAEPRESALGFALQQGDEEMARWAIEAGSIYESQLAGLRSYATQLSEPVQALLAEAESRPDPPPPTLTAAELARYAGLFEGWDTGGEVEVTVRDGGLAIRLPGGEPVVVQAVGQDAFQERSPAAQEGEAPDAAAPAGAGSLMAARFFGRAGSIEGLTLVAPGREPETMRRSVAEPVAAARAKLAQHGAQEAAGEDIQTVNWPGFRGPNASGNGDGAPTPVEWDVASGAGVLWSTKIDGLGNSSPVVWGDTVLLTTAVADIEQTIRTGLTGDGTGITEAVEHSWQVLAFDKRSGALRWRTEVGTGVPLTRRHFKATQANSTAVTDGRYVVAIFPTAGLACLGMDGTLRWKHALGGLNAGSFYDPKDEWGYASSPMIYRDTVIAQIDVHGGAYLAAWNLDTGEQVWRTERDVAPSWATPVLLAGPDGPELVVNGSTIHGYDPATGGELWSLGPNSELVIAAPVVGDGVVYVSAGYPPVKPIYALRSGTRGDLRVSPGQPHERLLWSYDRGGAYLPTPLLYHGIFYLLHHNGRLVAYDPETGDALSKIRFSQGGTFTGSPVAADGKLYLSTEEGVLYVLAAGPEPRELAVHEFGEPLMATPAISEGMLFVRTPTRLLALGSLPPEPEAAAAGAP
jgi:outer membrane protein assembly factor BamB